MNNQPDTVILNPEQLRETLLKRNNQFAALYKISQMLTTARDSQTMYHAIYNQVVQEQLHTAYFGVYLLGERLNEGHNLYVVIGGKVIPREKFPIMPIGEDFADTVLRRAEPIIHTYDDPAVLAAVYPEIPAEAWRVKTILFVPLIAEDQVMGMMWVGHEAGQTFSDDDIQLVSIAANYVAIMLAETRLFEQINLQSAELTALYNATSSLFKSSHILELGQQIVQAIVKEFAFADCGLMLVTKGQDKLLRLARAGEYVVMPSSDLFLSGRGLVPEAIRSRAIVYAPDVKLHPLYVDSNSLTRSELVVPLEATSGVIGALDLQSAQLNAFSERDRRVLSAFAERAAAALEIVQLYEERDHYVAELEFRVALRMAEVQRAKDKVETILNNTRDVIILISETGHIEQVNPAFMEAFGYTSDEIFDHRISEIIVSDVNAVIKAIVETEQSRRVELIAQRRDTTTFDADAIFSLITSTAQDRKQLICSLRDISAQKQLEIGLREALEREKELGELKARFSSTVSHEFRTPLAVIQSSTGILQSYIDRLSVEKRKEHLDKIASQIQRLTKLMDEVLLLSKSDAVDLNFKPLPTDVVALANAIIEEVVASSAQNHRVDFHHEGSCSDMPVDEALFRHILQNLLTNALKYSPETSPVTIHLICNESGIQLMVQDHGIGIPLESQRRLFETFYRASNVGNISGTGLGLAIVKRAVEAHHGTIQYESVEGQGTTFWVRLELPSALETAL
jgi:PAS domain S-box-containing protein